MDNDIISIYRDADAGALEALVKRLDEYDSESLARSINVLSIIIGNAALLIAERPAYQE